MSTEHGTVGWNELNIRNFETAGAFYKEMFGWELKIDRPVADLPEYGVFLRGDTQLGGCMKLEGPQFEGVPSNWLTYFAVDDVDAAAQTCTRAGGSVLNPPTDVGNMLRFAVCADPEGAVFAVMKMNPEASA